MVGMYYSNVTQSTFFTILYWSNYNLTYKIKLTVKYIFFRLNIIIEPVIGKYFNLK